jgi:hypothetical protein
MDPSKSIVRLNPNEFVFTDWDQFSYSLYIICEDSDVAKKIQKLEMQDEKYERLFGMHRSQKKDDLKSSKIIDGANFEEDVKIK